MGPETSARFPSASCRYTTRSAGFRPALMSQKRPNLLKNSPGTASETFRGQDTRHFEKKSWSILGTEPGTGACAHHQPLFSTGWVVCEIDRERF